MTARVVTLTTDFGSGDWYVGAMKGVILTICPQARIVDITHEIPPQDVFQAAWVLRHAAAHFPPATVHVVVVDPGVGTSRRALAVEARGQRFLGPDNGVFTGILGELPPDAPPARIVELTEPRFFLPEVSATFHGRDVFAPVAAHLCEGLDPAALGPAVQDIVQLPWPVPGPHPEGGLAGQVVVADRFGNCVTNLDAGSLRALGPLGSLSVWVEGYPIGPVRRTYGEAAPGEPVALLGSGGFLEIAVAQGSFQTLHRAGRGTQVRVARTTETT